MIKPQLVLCWEQNRKVYGLRKLWHQMRREGFDIGRDQTWRLMKELNIEGARRGKKFKTTRADKSAPRPSDLVDRNFWARCPNELWVTDFTYVPTWSGMVYVALVLDVFSRKIVGWRVASSMKTSFVVDALEDGGVVQRR